MELGKYKNVIISVIVLLAIVFLFLIIKSAYIDLKDNIQYSKLKNGSELEYSNLTINKYKDNKFEVVLELDFGGSFNPLNEYYVSALIEDKKIVQIFSKAQTTGFKMSDFNNAIELIFSDYYEKPLEQNFIKTKLALKPNLTYEDFFNDLILKVDFNLIQPNLMIGFVYNFENIFNQYELNDSGAFAQVKTNAKLNYKCTLIDRNFS